MVSQKSDFVSVLGNSSSEFAFGSLRDHLCEILIVKILCIKDKEINSFLSFGSLRVMLSFFGGGEVAEAPAENAYL